MTATNSNKKHIISTTATATATATISTNTLMYFLIALVLSLSQFHTVHGSIIISFKEEQCLEKTGTIFEGADKDLLDARHDFSSSMEMDMTSRQKMYAKYPEEKMKRYDTACTKNGGMLHTIKLDFFDCTLRGSNDDIELTLKNFANCMANVDECKDFGQEHLLQEAWEELGLHCALEDGETKKDPPASDNNNDDDKKKDTTNDDIAKKEKEAAAKGADDVEKEEKKSEYIPKEEAGKKSSSSPKKKRFGGFMKFILFVSVCGVGYFVFDRRRRGLPLNIQLPPWAGGASLPFGGVTTSRFQEREPAPTGYVSNYNLLSGEEEIDYNVNNELQLSSNLTA
mmetsp:Transcript_37093/g.41777  ORF Transcript_37093/g.41777 Transcript_37093/m.41777 type:complete len:340 (-) Transcript_37093:224-1243(-)